MDSNLKLTRPLAAALSAAALGLSALPAHAVTIVTTFDQSITSMANSSAIQAAFNNVANLYSSQFANPVTVNVTVSWGSVAGQSLPSNALGASVDYLYGYYSYADVRAALAATAAGNPADTSLATALAHMPANAPSGVSLYAVPSAEAKALGLIPGAQAGPDGFIGFAGAASGFDFNPLDGVGAGTYDFEGVAAHELAEVMGRISGLEGPTGNTFRTPFDLFRYKSAGVLDFAWKDAASFSIDGGVTKLKSFNANKTGGDRGDWASSASTSDVQDAFASTGKRYNLTNVDLTVLDVLGWTGSNKGNTGVAKPGATAFALATRGVPEPSAWAMLLTGFAGLGLALRRRRAAAVARA